MQGLIVLEDPTFINQTLLFSGDIAILSDSVLKGSNGGIEANLNGKLGAIGTANVDLNSFGGFWLRRSFSGCVTSHGVLGGREIIGTDSCELNAWIESKGKWIETLTLERLEMKSGACEFWKEMETGNLRDKMGNIDGKNNKK